MTQLLSLPFDENSSYLRGAADGPEAIRAALFSGSSNQTSESGRDIEFYDSGYVSRFDEITVTVEDRLKSDHSLICLGGDHSVTYPVLRAYARKYSDLTVVHFDAHPDLYDSYDGNALSHASPFARIMEESLASRLVQIGIRTMNAHQRSQAERFGVEIVEAKDFSSCPKVAPPVYVTIDLDVFDPAFAPGVSHHEPGGLSSRDVISCLQSLPEIIGADVVELNPKRDVSGITAALAAKLCKELAARMR